METRKLSDKEMEMAKLLIDKFGPSIRGSVFGSSIVNCAIASTVIHRMGVPMAIAFGEFVFKGDYNPHHFSMEELFDIFLKEYKPTSEENGSNNKG